MPRSFSEPITAMTETITLGVQSGGDDDRTNEHVLELRKLLAAYCKGPYSEQISEFALVLRIGSNMQEFDFEGCERIRRDRKDKVQEAKLLNDFTKVKQHFLASSPD
jgi:hypothetical protein